MVLVQYHLGTDVFDKKFQYYEKFFFMIGYMDRPCKLIVYENVKVLDTGCSGNGFVMRSLNSSKFAALV